MWSGLVIKKFLHNYLKYRKQNVKIDHISKFFKIVLLGVPQGSILDPILFKMFLTKSDLHNFADGNTIAVTCSNMNDSLHTLEKAVRINS